MARLLPSSPSSLLPIHSMLFSVLAILSIFSMVMYLCASHKRRTKEGAFGERKKHENYNLLSRFTKGNINDNDTISISSKALLKMISSRKHGDDHEDHDHDYVDDEEDHGDHAVWKKTIIMGEKCRPVDFSGKIEYDSQGNLLHH